MTVYYKYKGLHDELDIDRAIQIIKDKEVFCSDWRYLNDIMEGTFFVDPLGRTVAGEIVSAKQKLNVCCLSLNCKSKLMWAHYGNSFKGLAIGLSGPYGEGHTPEEVEYERSPSAFDPLVSVESSAKAALLRKPEEWSYEEEYRVVTDKKFVKFRKIEHVVLGKNIKSYLRREFEELCNKKGIEVKYLSADGYDLSLRCSRDH